MIVPVLAASAPAHPPPAQIPLALWIVFGALVVVSLLLDLVLHRGHKEMRTRVALAWAVGWIAVAVAFGIGVSPFTGADRTLNYFTAYLLEKALSVDNLFVFLVLFRFFAVPRRLQHDVLFWGILGALVMRAIFIFLGVALLTRFHFLFYVFGAFLVYTGIKLYFAHGAEVDPGKNLAYRLFKRLIPVSDDIESGRFFIRVNGKLMATRLLVVLFVVEATDVVFAVDSIPAVLAVTTDTFVVYTSNIFAILGLRALYFVLAGAMSRFRYLNTGLSFVLAFIGVKMLVADWFKVPPEASLSVVGSVLLLSIIASLVADRRDRRRGIVPAGPEPMVGTSGPGEPPIPPAA